MGQKTNPNSLRLITNTNWKNIWHIDKQGYNKLFNEDILLNNIIKNYLKKNKFYSNLVFIKRFEERILIEFNVYPIKTSQGLNITNLLYNKENKSKTVNFDTSSILNYLTNFVNTSKIQLNLKSIETPYNDPAILSQFIGFHIERRIPLRNIFQTIIKGARLIHGLKGLKLQCSGRINGVEMAKVSTVTFGNLSLQTFDEKVMYSTHHVNMKYGTLGFKIWVCYK